MRSILVLLALTLVGAVQVHAQQALVLFGYGVYNAPLKDLSPTDDIAPRFGYGGGLGVQLSPTVALRGSADIVRTKYRGTSLTLADSGLTRFYLMGDLQVGWPGTSSFVPYIVLGAGMAGTGFDDPSQDSATFPAARIGSGINYVGGLGAFFLEGLLTMYRWNATGFDRTQFDLTIHVGFALAVKI